MKKLLFALLIGTSLFACTNHQDELHNKMIAISVIQDGKPVDSNQFSDPELKKGEWTFDKTKDTAIVVMPSQSIVKK
jgi:hypothetical protein